MTDEEKEKQKREQEELNRKASRFARIFVLILGLIFLCCIAYTCSKMSGGGDDTWDRLNRSVHSDSYYKHW